MNSHFSEKYLTTVGVKVDTKEVPLPEMDVLVKLIIWDVAGADRFGDKELAYLRGASAHVFVVDGTRLQTSESAKRLHQQIRDQYGTVRNVLLLNKADLKGTWQIEDRHLALLNAEFDSVYRTSAKTGENVETALCDLAAQIVDKDLRA